MHVMLSTSFMLPTNFILPIEFTSNKAPKRTFLAGTNTLTFLLIWAASSDEVSTSFHFDLQA